MILFADSFDHYTASQMARKWTVASSIEIGTGRHGNGAQVKAPYDDLRYHWASPLSSFAAGCAHATAKFEGIPIRFSDLNGYEIAGLHHVGDGRFYVSSAQGGSSGPSNMAVHLNRWYYLEFTGTITLTQPSPPRYTLSFTVRLNDTLTILSGAISDINYSSPYARRFHPKGPYGPTYMTLDDLWLTDGELLGDVQVIDDLPTADGTYSDFIPSTPGVHYLMVDDPTPDDNATYLEGTLIGKKETHRFGESTDREIKGLQTVVCVDDGGGTISEFKPLLRSGAADILGDTKELPASYAYRLEAWRKSPFSDVDWSPAEYNGLEVGVESTA